MNAVSPQASYEPLTPTALLDRAAVVHADRVAVVDGELRLTYREFHGRCHWRPEWSLPPVAEQAVLRARQGVSNLVSCTIRVLKDGKDVPATAGRWARWPFGATPSCSATTATRRPPGGPSEGVVGQDPEERTAGAASVNALVKSADRTLAILELLTEHRDGLTLTEIQRLLELPKSSTYTLLVTMATRGFLEQDAETRRFRVGIRLWQAGQSYVAVADLERVALPYMEALRDGLNETVQLATLDGVDNVYIAKVDADQQLRLASRVGVRLPAHATAIGKGAAQPAVRRGDHRDGSPGWSSPPYTPNTITSSPALLTAIHEVRANGYATDYSEYTPEVFCVAAPFSGHRGGGRAAVSVSVPEARRTPEVLTRIIDGVRSTVHQLSLRTGRQDA